MKHPSIAGIGKVWHIYCLVLELPLWALIFEEKSLLKTKFVFWTNPWQRGFSKINNNKKGFCIVHLLGFNRWREQQHWTTAPGPCDILPVVGDVPLLGHGDVHVIEGVQELLQSVHRGLEARHVVQGLHHPHWHLCSCSNCYFQLSSCTQSVLTAPVVLCCV